MIRKLFPIGISPTSKYLRRSLWVLYFGKMFVFSVIILSNQCLFAENALTSTAVSLTPKELWGAGKYEESIKAYQDVISKDNKDYAVRISLAEIYFEIGKYEESLKAYENILQEEKEYQDASVGIAEIFFTKGEYKKSEELLKGAERNLKAKFLLCRIYMETGRYSECEKLAEDFVKVISDGISQLPVRDLVPLAQGLWLYAQRKGDKDIFHLVNTEILPYIEKVDNKNPWLYSLWGFCFLDKEDVPEAMDCFKDALKLNPKYSLANYGLALSLFYSSQGGGAQKVQAMVKNSLEFNPNFIEMINLRATIYLAEENEEEALKEADKGLKINPNSIPLLATKASIFYLNNDTKEFDGVCKKVLDINPLPAEFYYIIGNNCASMYKMLYLEAQPFYQKAVELDPKFWDGYIALGLNGLKCGPDAEKEARKLLEEAHNRDPFHPAVKNTLNVLDALEDEFVTTKTDHFTIKIDRSESEFIAPYITRLLEKDYKELTALYKFEPEPPLLIEMFPSMNDFSVRMTGLPGVDFALGVCFAKTFLVYSPEVQDKLRRRFHWGAVTTHEFTHIITLQLSKFHVPRWFTEGCSVWSEKLANPKWARKLEMEIYQVYESGKLQHMEQFTQKKGFDVIHTYLLSSIIVEYISKKYGMDKIILMLKGFGERKKQDVVFKEVLGKNIAEFDKEFFDYFENDWIKRIKIRKPPKLKEEVKLRERVLKNDKDEEALAELSFISFAKDKLLDAQEYASKALAVNPKNIKALITMGDVFYHTTMRRYETAIGYFSKALNAGADDFGTHFKLAVSYMRSDSGVPPQAGKTKQLDKAIKEFNESKKCLPGYIKYEDNPYYYLAQIYEEKGEKDKMVKELEAYVNIAHEDFTTQMKLAKIYRGNNQNEQLISLLEDLVYLDPKDLKLHAWLAEAYRSQKKYNEALREYKIEIFILNKLEQSEKRDKWISNFHCDMAEIYFEIGDKGEAKHFVGLALKENPLNDRAEKLSDKIGE
jgi:tetratricopeptide (TPR) repeat protein